MDQDNQSKPIDWGETFYQPKNEVDFTFSYKLQDVDQEFTVKIEIPLKKTVKELAYRLASAHSVPCYLNENLVNSLTSFIDENTKEFNLNIKNMLFGNLCDGDKKQQLIKQWGRAFSERQVTGRSLDASYDSTWSDIYHKLIHSPALEALLQLECSYSMAMKDVVKKKDDALKELREKQVFEMESMVSKVGTSKTDTDVNNLAAAQLEEAQILETYWSSEVSDLQETQKREYRQWVVAVYEKSVADNSFNNIQSNFRTSQSMSTESFHYVSHGDASADSLLMEESFTIHLGTQMKTMHNIRLVCRDILDYCQCRISYVGGSMIPHPQRLQTAMSLYSQSLSAMLFLVDDRFDTLSGTKKDFINICNESTDFHFTGYEKQVCVIEQALQERPVRKRGGRSMSFQQNRTEPNGEKREKQTNNLLQTGDFYITKHSNLAEVHAVFHLVSDESVTSSNINSRHAILIGIRNIMLAAARHNITNMIIPLLLVHEMGENLTIQWCMKRAELVFKCVKGFMMESLSWDGHESRTLQFVVPPGISEDMFLAFSNMLPSIFRVSNPLDLSNLSVK